ncbi:hypothetical protein C2S52_008638 [Perilla frutescens var. hirtella]|nr:hypothetical protein C2S52_008638 [Perilla frutescens var. hirtella]
MTAMLTAPDANNRPLFAAKDLAPFYVDNGPNIFSNRCGCGLLGSVGSTVRALVGPKYDGKYLQQVIRDNLGHTRLHQTLTNIVIPTFDIRNMQPTIFSSYQSWDFNLIDGGVAANNPTLVAIREAMKQVLQNYPDFFPVQPLNYDRLLVISLGTGAAKQEQKYTAEMAAKWGVFSWLIQGNSSPIIDVYNQSSKDMVDYFLSVVFQALNSQDNYLRIQDETLKGAASSIDITTKENLAELVKIGQDLLRSPASRVNLQTGNSEPIPNGGTNQDALIKFAKILSDEQNLRRSTSQQQIE